MFQIPEGPEVECVKRELQELVNLTVSKAQLTDLALKYNRYVDQREKIDLIQNQKIVKIERRGKFIVWWFGSHPVVNHLGMTGAWVIQGKESSKSTHQKVILDFKEGKKAIFDDVRNFGRFEIFRDEEELLKKTESIRNLGVNGLELPFPQTQFEELLTLKRNQDKQIGSLLLDQRVVAGVGNIYKSESLFRARIHPVTPVNKLSNKEIFDLGLSISEILQLALESGGSTIDNFQSPYGSEGKAQEWHKVYGREGKQCLTCGTGIERLVQNTRSTFFCSVCQPLKEGIIIPESVIPKKDNQKKTRKKELKLKKKTGKKKKKDT